MMKIIKKKYLLKENKFKVLEFFLFLFEFKGVFLI